MYFTKYMQVNSINNTSFTGIPISEIKVKGKNSIYKLYDISPKDSPFLNRMYDSINLKKNYPGLSEKEYFLWQGLLKTGVENAANSDKKVLLETCDNVPCGILNYIAGPKRYNLSYIVTFPTKPKEKVPCAGQILFNELFKRFIPDSANFIELQAMREAPFSPVTKYLRLGFKMHGGDSISEEMSIGKDGATAALAKQKEFLTSKVLSNQPDEDFDKTLHLIDELA